MTLDPSIRVADCPWFVMIRSSRIQIPGGIKTCTPKSPAIREGPAAGEDPQLDYVAVLSKRREPNFFIAGGHSMGFSSDVWLLP